MAPTPVKEGRRGWAGIRGTRPSQPRSCGLFLLPQQNVYVCEICDSLSLQGKESFPSSPCLSTISDYGKERSALSSQPLKSLGRKLSSGGRRGLLTALSPGSPGLRGKQDMNTSWTQTRKHTSSCLWRAPSMKCLRLGQKPGQPEGSVGIGW